MKSKVARISIELAAATLFGGMSLFLAGGVAICAYNISNIIKEASKS